MFRYEKITVNSNFGSWTVIGRDENSKRKQWLCRCLCGEVKSIPGRTLKNGRSTKCVSCRLKELAKGGCGSIPGSLWNRYKNSAKKRNITFEITCEYAWGLFLKQNGKCALTNSEISFTGIKKYNTASLDRIDSRKGYIPGNVQWLHVNVNKLKLDLEQEKFVELCSQISLHHANRIKEANGVHPTLSKYVLADGESIIIDLERSFGSHIVDQKNGRRFLDCSSQYASMPLGWNHPKLIERLSEINKYAIHKIANSDYYSVPLAEFVHTFAGIAPDFNHFFFVEGGTLGVENALKAAFDWKMKKLGLSEADANSLDVVHLEQAFHGRSGYTLSLTNTVPNKTALFPKFNWSRIKNPKIHFPLVESETTVVEELSLRQAEDALKTNRVAAIILETIQGEGGDNHFSSEYFAALRKMAFEYEAMLILDEVQTGVGLTGTTWAYEHHAGLRPDMIAFGKKTQVCGFASTTRIDEVPDNVFKQSSRINSTWGGNIIDMIRFTHIAQIMKEDDILNQVAIVGDYFLKQLLTVPRITNVRGKGLMLAFDLETPEARNAVLDNLLKRMTVLPCGERSIRLRPHLIFSMADVDEAIDIIKHAV